MAEIVVVGGGIGGLVTGALLARDGNDVTVLERDPGPPPAAEEAWDTWERRGVNQFRLPHFVIPAFREMVDAELPELADAMVREGAHRFDMLAAITGGAMSDPRFDSITARRPVLESMLARFADETPGLEIRRGAGVAGLVAAPERDGTPHVKGVLLEDGSKLGADLTVVATGRRTALPAWLEAIGAAPIAQEQEDSGFVYYGKHISSGDGSPVIPGPSYVHFGTVSLLALPGDRGTAGVGVIGVGHDAALRPLLKEGPWQAVVGCLPGGQAILDARPISPLVFMGSLEDRWCRLAPEGRPVATGVAVVADAFSSTNPSVGRGVSLGFRSAIALRDTFRKHGDHPRHFAEEYDRVLQGELTPWYRATVWNDRQRLEEVNPLLEGRPAAHPPEWDDFRRINMLPGKDMSVLPRLLNVGALLKELPAEVMADVSLRNGAADIELPGQHDHPGPSREELLSVIASAR
jgi:2-polyprenyl-6-methoxyphenol hydroxylase-like FAD-dependent oxidoreductase